LPVSEVCLIVAEHIPSLASSASFRQRLVAKLIRPSISIPLIGLLAFGGSAAVGLLAGISEPRIHDEFSYLLAGDTFAHGRLTNPTHPMWINFESLHVIHQPTYMSKYPPAQGLILALGRLVGGHPIVGVWLSMGLMCAAICWMLHAWMPHRWAAFGGFLAVINPVLGFGGYWAQSYWGGAVAATGGALVVGGVRYLVREPRVPYALLFGAGLAILANSRPYEGLLVGVSSAVMLMAWLVSKDGPPIEVALKRIFFPFAIVVVLTVAWMAVYNFRTTGSILRMPYQIHEATYAMAPTFIWQAPPSRPDYRHPTIRDHHRAALRHYTVRQSFTGYIRRIVGLFYMAMQAINVLAIPLIATFTLLLHWILVDRWARFASVTYLALVLGLLMEVPSQLHYWAPIIALNYFFAMTALRFWKRRYQKGTRLAPLILVLLALAGAVISMYTVITQNSPSVSNWHIRRALLSKKLRDEEGQHLLIVTYGPKHWFKNDWVYNEADIDRAKVAWARGMDSERNCKLIEYFRGWRIWSLEVDDDRSAPILKPYPMSQCSSG
jgi:hypothetical protein